MQRNLLDPETRRMPGNYRPIMASRSIQSTKHLHRLPSSADDTAAASTLLQNIGRVCLHGLEGVCLLTLNTADLPCLPAIKAPSRHGNQQAAASQSLMGKHKPIYDPSTGCGDYIIAVGCHDLHTTGKKKEKKYYSRFTRPGRLQEITMERC